jgi:hypothetical protein
MREYLLRGGFFMADDFHGNVERGVFEEAMKLVFPERPIVEIPDDDTIFHIVYDLKALPGTRPRPPAAGLQELRRRRRGRALARHLRRQRPGHDCDFVQLGFG